MQTKAFLADLSQAPAVLVTVHASRGSVPRELGAWMAVFQRSTHATVGGGRLEHDAMAHARTLLERPELPNRAEVVRYSLGPSLGQCCGGEVHLRFEPVTAQDIPALQTRLMGQPRSPVALFGGGHVGRALVQVLSHLPLDVHWIDSRDEAFPAPVAGVVYEHSHPVQAAVPLLRADSRVVVMSFSHAEDWDIVAACLHRQRKQGDLPYVGLIGSATKWASFRRRLQARGFTPAELAHITCPIGIAGIKDKRPEVIAVAVAAQLLQVQEGKTRA